MPEGDRSAQRGDGPRLLAGGNPQIPEGEGDGAVQAYIDAMPGWKSDVGRQLDALIEEAVPHVVRSVKWNQPMYGVEGKGSRNSTARGRAGCTHAPRGPCVGGRNLVRKARRHRRPRTDPVDPTGGGGPFRVVLVEQHAEPTRRADTPGHPLRGHRMPDLDLVTTDGPTRVSALMHDARPAGAPARG